MQRTKPPFRADHVGSLLRPAALKAARERRARGGITAGALQAVEDREIKDAIKKQEAAGLQSITDGEFRRSWWHLDFLWGLDGVEKTVMETGIAFAGTRTRNEGTKVTGKIGFSGHPMIEHFKFVKAHTTRTPKITIPAPSALYGRTGVSGQQPLRTPDDWWTIVLGWGYRWTVEQMDPETVALVREENLKVLRANEIKFIETNVIYAVATKR